MMWGKENIMVKSASSGTNYLHSNSGFNTYTSKWCDLEQVTKLSWGSVSHL